MSLRLLNDRALDSRPAAVLFDLDDTFYPYDPANAAAMRAVYEKIEASLNLSGPAVQEAFASARGDVKKRLGKTASSHSRLLYFQRMMELLGLKSQPLMALDLEQTYWRTFLLHAELFPRAMEVLIEFRALGIPLAIVTDLTAQIQFRKLVHFNIDRYFDVVVTSEEAGVDKEGLDPFRLAMEKLDLAPDSPAWVIGDNPCDTVAPKRALNAVTMQKLAESDSQPLHDGVDAAFRHFGDLWSVLKAWSDQDEAAAS